MTIAYNLKNVFTLDEACAELSERFKEQISPSKLFEFEQVGGLTISISSPIQFPVANSLLFAGGERSVTEGVVEQLPASIYATAIEQKERYGSDWRVILVEDAGKFAWVDYIGTTIINDVELGVYLNKPELPSYLQLVVAKQDLDAFIAKAQGSDVVDGGKTGAADKAEKSETAGEAALRLAKYFFQLDAQDEKPNNRSLKEYAELVTERLYLEGHRCPQSKLPNRKHNPKSIERLYLNGSKWWQIKNSFIEN